MSEPAPYDYEAKGRADFDAGARDVRLYDNAERHGEAYRRGWQQARRDREAADLGLNVTVPGAAPASPTFIAGGPGAPTGGTFTIESFGVRTRPIPHDASPAEVGDAIAEVRPRPVGAPLGGAFAVTGEDVRLARSEDKKPRKAKPKAADPAAPQLDLFS